MKNKIKKNASQINALNIMYNGEKFLDWDDRIPMIRLNAPKSILMIVLSALLSYYKSVHGDFVFDDSEAIVNNDDVKPTTPLYNIFYHDFWGTRLNNTASHKSYRPFTILAFRLIYQYYGELSPYPFHVVNIFFHCAVSVLAYFAYRIILNKSCLRASLLCALMFATHPVHTECVAGIVGLTELLSAFFGFIGFIIYTYSCNSIRSCIGTIFYVSLSCILCIVAMLSKEQGISVIGVCSAYDLIINGTVTEIANISLFGDISFVEFKKNNADKKMSEKLSALRSKAKYIAVILWRKYRLLILRHVILLIFTTLALYFRWRMMGSLPIFQLVDNPASFEKNFLTRAVNYSYVYCLNIWLLLCPNWLCFDWSMGCVPLIYINQFTSDFRILIVILFWLFFLVFISCTLFNHDGLTQRALIIGLLSMVILFLPASNILFTVGFVVAERVLYLPSFGFFLIIVAGIRIICKLPKAKQLVRFLVIMLIMMFTARSMERSIEWTTEKQLFQSALSICPLNAKVHYNLGKTAADDGHIELAVEYYNQALRLNTKYDQAMNNLANILKDRGQLQEAANLLSTAISLRPDFAAAWMNLGIVSASLKQYNKSEHCYLIALSHRKNYPDCYYNLGNLYLEQGRNIDAYKAWINAITQKPTHKVAWSNIIVMLDSLGDYEGAVNMANKALEFLPREPSIHFNLANVLGKMNKFQESEEHFVQAIQLRSNYAMYHVNLGVLYHRWNKFCKAKREYEIALQLDKNSKNAKTNLQRIGKFPCNSK